MSRQNRIKVLIAVLLVAVGVAIVLFFHFTRQEIGTRTVFLSTLEARGIFWEYPDGTPAYAMREYDVESTVEVPLWKLGVEHELRQDGQILQQQTIELDVTAPITVGHGLFAQIPSHSWDRNFLGVAEDWCRVHWYTEGDDVFGPCETQEGDLVGPDSRHFYLYGLVRGDWCRLYFPFIAVDRRAK